MKKWKNVVPVKRRNSRRTVFRNYDGIVLYLAREQDAHGSVDEIYMHHEDKWHCNEDKCSYDRMEAVNMKYGWV